MFVARDNLKRLTTERLAGSADLVVEIISEWSVTHDTKIKRAEYEAAAIPEYWLLDARPRHSRARFLQLDPDGHYQESPPDGAGRYYSVALPGFWLDVGWLWQHPWPDPDELKPLMLAHRDAMRGEKSE
jgi:Uma2 family endonuclease